MILAGPYRPRQVVPEGIWEIGDWRLKTYRICADRSPPDLVLSAAARVAVRATLPSPASGEGRYGVGFMGVHQGLGANMVFLDWWADENELHHHAWVSRPGAPGRLEAVTAQGLLGCVWDLAVIGFERDAWIATVLANGQGPDREGYLARWLAGPV